uniref:DUF4131 domain-containing protein n=1 Tax=Aquisalimonas sp. TaxID=1872621 RepID=UPI0025C3345C
MSLPARACGAFAAGVVSFHFGSAMPDAAGWCLLLAGSALLLRGRRWLLLGALFLGMLWSAWHAAQALEFRLDQRMTGEVTVAVAGLPIRDGNRLTFNARITGPPGTSGPRRARLHWYGPPQRVEPGERWQL